ncbi:MAG: anti-sigma T factor NepR [Caulobacteraceae bacterium]
MIEQRAMRKPSARSIAVEEARLRQQAIGVKLRQMFDAVVNEPVPDEFLEILRRGDERPTEKG